MAIWELTKTFGLAIFSILIAAAIARSWQHRNWIAQQRISDREKLYLEVKQLFDGFMELASQRHFRSKRLYWSLVRGNQARIDDARQKYDEVVHKWNDANLSWEVRFARTLEDGYDLSREIDQNIRVPFVEIGRLLERGLRNLEAGVVPLLESDDRKQIEKLLAVTSRRVFELGRQIYTDLQSFNDYRLDGEKEVQRLLDDGKYGELTAPQIFKAIFSSPHQ